MFIVKIHYNILLYKMTDFLGKTILNIQVLFKLLFIYYSSLQYILLKILKTSLYSVLLNYEEALNV